jgi:adhesin transport system outer membrane protein
MPVLTTLALLLSGCQTPMTTGSLCIPGDAAANIPPSCSNKVLPETTFREIDQARKAEAEKAREAAAIKAAMAGTQPADPAQPPAVAKEQPTPAKRFGLTVPKWLAGETVDITASTGNDLTVTAKGKPAKPAGPLSLAAVVRLALKDNPQIGLAAATTWENEAGVDQSRSALFPQIELRGATGQGLPGNYQSQAGSDYWDTKQAYGAWRSDAAVGAKQLLWDWGATRSDIDRAVKTRDAQALKTLAVAEDVALSASQAYLKVQESRELLSLSEENLQALRQIAALIEENARSGNGTQADIKRVTARVLDAQSARADQEYELKVATDKFRRLARTEPDRLLPAPQLTSVIPPTKDAALAEVMRSNPRVLGIMTNVKAARAERDAIQSANLPRVGIDSEIAAKHYNGQTRRTELDARGMVSLTYRLYDGGLNASKVEQASARITQEEMRLKGEEEDIEADLRNFYWLVGSSRSKTANLRDAVQNSAKARELYQEQFKGGKRSLLELLEVQQSYYIAKRGAINNTYEERRAVYGILKAVGRFSSAVLAGSANASHAAR